MSIYYPLENYLKKQALAELSMTFDDVAAVLGRALPRSAFNHRPWWANEAAGHSHARAWLNAGFETSQVDMAQRRLVFRRIATSPPPQSAPRPMQGLGEWSRHFRPKEAPGMSLFGALKGTFTIEAGWDLASPTLEDELDIDRTADLVDSGLRKHS